MDSKINIIVEKSNMNLITNIENLNYKDNEELIELHCLKCDKNFEKRLDRIMACYYAEKFIICNHCKYDKLIEKNLKKSECELTKDDRIRCLKCSRIYDNDPAFYMKCYCKKQRIQEEKYFDIFTDFNCESIYKEYSTQSLPGKNFDIFCEFGEYNVFIEVDDIGHFKNKNIKRKDFMITDQILQKDDELGNVLLIRINDTIRNDKKMREIKEFIKKQLYRETNGVNRLILVNESREYDHLIDGLTGNIEIIQFCE